ncbi:MAG: hypothetical protein ACMXYF_01525 [Candidatus Woesearchaeota archaeon]
MRRTKKVYGEYKTDICPFCGKKAFCYNNDRIAVCQMHKNTTQPHLVWSGEVVQVKKGKYGNYCQTFAGDIVALKKVLAANNIDVQDL